MLLVALAMPGIARAAPVDEQAELLRDLMAAADARTVRPVDQLESLSFEVPFVVPAPLAESVMQQIDPRAPDPPREAVRLATVRVHWQRGREPEVVVVPDEQARDARPLLSEALLPQAESRGRQLLGMVLNERPDVDRLLADFAPEVLPQPDDTTRVVLTPRRPHELLPLLRLEWTFGPEGLPLETLAVSRLPEDAGAEEMVSRQVSHWSAVGDDAGVRLTRLESHQDAGALGTARSDLALRYEDVDGLPLLVEFEEEASGPGLAYSLRTRLQDVRFTRRD